jgi:hypothetical protein
MKPQRLLLSTKFTPLNEWGDDRKGSLSVFPTRAGAPRSVDSVIVSKVEGITFYIRHRSLGTTLAACGNPGRDSLEILNEGACPSSETSPCQLVSWCRGPAGAGKGRSEGRAVRKGSRPGLEGCGLAYRRTKPSPRRTCAGRHPGRAHRTLGACHAPWRR